MKPDSRRHAMAKEHHYIDFDEYIRQGEPAQREAAYAWSTAIGLQAVDGLTTSEYLNDLARRNIEGELTMNQVDTLLDSYYESKAAREAHDDDKNEADKASRNIKKILSVKTVDFTANGFISLHRRSFEGVFKHAGQLRDYDITKKEWVLEGDTVNYLNWEDLRRALDYDIKQEREFSYKGLTQDNLITHIASFVSGLWQIHAFGEGNTRTTAVFTIQYLRSIGFDVENDLFAKHSWYFRNALVRANYKNAVKGIDYSPIYLQRFFRNLLLGEQWDLRNRYLHIHPTEEWSVQPNLAEPNNTPISTPTSTPTSSHVNRLNPNGKFYTKNENIIQLVQVIGTKELSIKEMMELKGLKDRKNFIEYHLNPAISEGFVRLLHPETPRHPRQKYLLTAKGVTLYKVIIG